jgi:hypothetical protein
MAREISAVGKQRQWTTETMDFTSTLPRAHQPCQEHINLVKKKFREKIIDSEGRRKLL